MGVTVFRGRVNDVVHGFAAPVPVRAVNPVANLFDRHVLEIPLVEHEHCVIGFQIEPADRAGVPDARVDPYYHVHVFGEFRTPGNNVDLRVEVAVDQPGEGNELAFLPGLQFLIGQSSQGLLIPNENIATFSLPDECFTTYCLNVLNVRLLPFMKKKVTNGA